MLKYDSYFERGITEDSVHGPWDEERVLKALRCSLGISNEIAGIEDFTKEEFHTYVNYIGNLEDFSGNNCKNCKHKLWCAEGRNL